MLSLPLPTSPTVQQALFACLERLDPVLFQHAERVGRYAKRAGTVMGLSPGPLSQLEWAARLHDIGKLFIPSCLVHKPAAFTREEYDIMERHAAFGGHLLEAHPQTAALALAVRHHHDRWDRLGAAIPLFARLTAVADAYDAMTSDRYGGNRNHAAALAELVRCRGAQFCPASVDAFLASEARALSLLAS